MSADDELYKRIGLLVRAARERANLNQNDLAQLVRLTRTSITNVEAGRQKIQVHTLFNIARALGVPPESLFPFEELTASERIDEQIKELNAAERGWVKRVLDLDENYASTE